MLKKKKVYDYDYETLFKFLKENNLSTNLTYYSNEELSMLIKAAKKDETEFVEKMKKENHKKMMNLLIKRKVIDCLRIPGEYIKTVDTYDPAEYLIENGFDPSCMSIEKHCIDIKTDELVCFIKVYDKKKNDIS